MNVSGERMNGAIACPVVEDHAAEVSAGARFEFGANWSRFLNLLDERRIDAAVQSLKHYLQLERLDGKTFLDIGSGSGLFSLAARRLGARVVSFDFDPLSVACTRELKRRFFNDDGQWQVLRGSILDAQFMGAIGTFDVVYSWGVLHHTGQMRQALEHAAAAVKPAGSFYIAIYNDQGSVSRWWLAVKRLYNRLPKPATTVFAFVFFAYFRLRARVGSLVLRTAPPFSARGMNPWRDCVDWIGGYPFEVARPEVIFDFCRARGFQLERLDTRGRGHGCNEYVFSRQ